MDHQLIRTLRTALHRFRRDRNGSIAPIAAVVMIAALTGVSASIDIARLVTARTQLQDAVDSANLVLARMPATTSDADMKAKAQAWINANVTDPNIENLVVATPVRTIGQVQLNVTGSIKTTLASLLGITTLPLEGHSTVAYGLTHVELALVLDNTNSMNANNKLASLKTAAKTLIDTLYASAAASGDANALKVALVPFTMTVNVGASYKNANWISGAMPAEYGATGDAVAPSHPNRFTLFNNLGVQWGGCLEARPQPYDVQETPPTASNPATMFVPFFAPDEPDAGTYWSAADNANVYNYKSVYDGQSENWIKSTIVGGKTLKYYSENSYIPDNAGTGNASWSYTAPAPSANAHHQNMPGKYTNAPDFTVKNPQWSTAQANDYVGPNSGCDVQKIQRLTTDVSSVKTQIDSMIAMTETQVPLGLMWGWHVLSPFAPFADGTPYGTANTVKVVVLVTDGNNFFSSSANINRSHYTAYGYADQKRIGDGTASGVESALDDRLQTLCKNMKQHNPDGSWKINIYAVPVEVNNGGIKNLLKGCVTDTDNYIDATDSSQLGAAFSNIAGSIQKLRIAH